MKSTAKSLLTQRREAFRLWFEYLRLARMSNKTEVKAALVVSQPIYARWEMGKNLQFDAWWKTHGHLFEEKSFVRQLQAGDSPSDPNALIIEIPLTLSPTELMRKVKPIIQAAFTSQAKPTRKSKKHPTAAYRLTEGAEPKLDAVREMLTVYRDVYLKYPLLRGVKLMTQIHAFYQGRKSKRWAKVPMALEFKEGDETRALRNMRRYIQKAEKVVLNVARGQFPGKY